MPRLPHSLLLRAYSRSSFLPLILRTTRDFDSAANELRWMKEHVEKCNRNSPNWPRHTLLALCKRRERGEPLQYILGSQPFGELVIKCRPGVLVPRPETEAYTTHLAKLVNEGFSSETADSPRQSSLINQKSSRSNENTAFKILDACSGSGCISLLLYSQLAANFPNISIQGWDISKKAIALAQENLQYNIREKTLPKTATEQVTFIHANILDTPQHLTSEFDDFDIIISNPPYISQQHYWKETTRSVRNWEPRLALVPGPAHQATHQNSEGNPEDVFYVRLVQLFGRSRRCKVLVMEVGDDEQATRVAELALFDPAGVKKARRVEVWRDFVDGGGGEPEILNVRSSGVEVKGIGVMRAVVVLATEPEKVEDIENLQEQI